MKGDTGGPMNLKNPDGSWTTIGIVSYGNASCEIGTPTLFTRIKSHITWIQSVINNDNIKFSTSKPVPLLSTTVAVPSTTKPYKSEANLISIPITMITICFIASSSVLLIL